MSAPLRPRHLVGTAVPIVEARLDKDWDCERGHDLLVVDECPFCGVPHYYMTWALWHPAGGAIGQVVDAHCRDNRRRNRADRRYLMLDRDELKARARAYVRAFLAASLELSSAELDTVMTRGFEALWSGPR